MTPEQKRAHKRLLTSLPKREVIQEMEPEEVYVLTRNVRVEKWLLEDRPLSQSEKKYLWQVSDGTQKSSGSIGTEHFPRNHDEAKCFV